MEGKMRGREYKSKGRYPIPTETAEFTVEPGNYLTLRKKMKQEIRKALRNLKGKIQKILL